MTQTIQLRTITSLTFFAVLIATFTFAYAESPNRMRIAVPKIAPAVAQQPAPSIRLAEAKTKRKTRALPKAEESVSDIEPINLNTATVLELTKLPGIGPKKAQSIVTWRNQHGRFHRIVDLRRVKGFGAKTVKRLRPYLSVKGKSKH